MINGNITQMHCKKSNNIIKTLSMTENMHEWQLKELKGIATLHMLHILLSWSCINE